MLLSYRPATAADFIAATDVLMPWYNLPAADLALAWEGILAREGVWSLVIETQDDVPEPISLSLSVFVSDRMADRFEAGRSPNIAGAIVNRFLTKGDEPLSLDRIRAAHHAGGLNLVSLHTAGLKLERGGSPTGIVGELRSRVCFEAVRGYRIKRCLREVFSAQAFASFTAGGWRLRHDYASHFGSASTHPTLERPFLLGLNREEAATEETGGARMAAMFHDYPVRLSLRRVHRELLSAALDGLTDAELSGRLSLSPSAIKKRWSSVYDHVDGLIPGMPAVLGRADKTRGAERRRHVLNYLREHPEEFRPLID